MTSRSLWAKVSSHDAVARVCKLCEAKFLDGVPGFTAGSMLNHTVRNDTKYNKECTVAKWEAYRDSRPPPAAAAAGIAPVALVNAFAPLPAGA